MKKMTVVLAVLTLLFAFSINVMAEPSPDLYDKTTAATKTTEDDSYYEETTENKTEKETDSYYKKDKNASPKTGDSGASATLVYIALAAAALSVYAARRAKEQY